MKCPRDKHSLKRKISERMIGNGCNHCNGIFITGNKTQNYQNTIEKQLIESTKPTKPSKNSNLLCPNCMTTMKMTYVENIEIDICTNCLGVWFDKTEVQAVIEKYNQSSDNKSDSRFSPYPSEFVHLLSKWFLNKSKA